MANLLCLLIQLVLVTFNSERVEQDVKMDTITPCNHGNDDGDDDNSDACNHTVPNVRPYFLQRHIYFGIFVYVVNLFINNICIPECLHRLLWIGVDKSYSECLLKALMFINYLLHLKDHANSPPNFVTTKYHLQSDERKLQNTAVTTPSFTYDNNNYRNQNNNFLQFYSFNRNNVTKWNALRFILPLLILLFVSILFTVIYLVCRLVVFFL